MRTNLTVFLIVALLISGCGPQSKLRRAKRLIASAESSGAVWAVDSVFKTIEITVPQIDLDTVFRDVNFIDTLVLTKEKVITRVKVNTVTKEVFVKTTCPEQKKKVVVTHTVTKTIHAGASTWEIVKLFLIGFAAGVILCGAYRLLR